MFVDWLNETFHTFDYALLELCHKLAEFGHPVLTDILHFISFSGEYAILLFLSGVILCMFPKTRKAGVSEIGSVLIGCIIGKGFLKRVVARPRPYEVVGSDYFEWWSMLGLRLDTDTSFPSGHVEVAIAGLLALCLMLPDGKGKKLVPFTTVYVSLMCLSRIYMMEHYPSDVVAGLLIGTACTLIGVPLTKWFFNLCEKNKDKAFCNFVINFELSWLKGKKK